MTKDQQERPIYCECGQPAAHRLLVTFRPIQIHQNYARPERQHSYRKSRTILFLCPGCYEREQRQKEGYA